VAVTVIMPFLQDQSSFSLPDTYTNVSMGRTLFIFRLKEVKEYL